MKKITIKSIAKKVGVSTAAVSYTAKNYLISKGRKILFINGPPDYTRSVQHIQGSEMALRENGLKIESGDMIHIPMMEELAYNALKSIGTGIKNYSAILAYHNVFNAGIMIYLKENNIHVSQDIAYISLGNSRFSRLCSPAITSMDMAPYEMGYQSSEILIDVIEKRRVQPSHNSIPVEFAERESV